jgi:hypothetical protein
VRAPTCASLHTGYSLQGWPTSRDRFGQYGMLSSKITPRNGCFGLLIITPSEVSTFVLPKQDPKTYVPGKPTLGQYQPN